MQRPARWHFAIAALVISAVLALLVLATMRYIDWGRTRRASTFEALAAALQMASTRERQPDAEAALLFSNGQVHRAFFVEKGLRVDALDISRPARVTWDLSSDGSSDDGTNEKLLTLCAMLDRHFLAGGTIESLSPKELSWFQRSGEMEVTVGTWPVLDAAGGFIGVAGVEARTVPPQPFPLIGAVIAVCAFVSLFVVGLFAFHKPRLAFTLAAIPTLCGLTVALTLLNSHGSSSFVLQRDKVATLFVNRVPLIDPKPFRLLDHLWTDVFKETKQTATIAPIKSPPPAVTEPDNAQVTVPLVFIESSLPVERLAASSTIPVLLILLAGLAIGALVLPFLASLIKGIAEMPGVYAYIVPAMGGMLVLVLTPFIMGIGLGFFNTDYEFVGFENFHDILFPSSKSDTNFYFTLGVTVLWTASNVLLHVSIGLLLAMILVSPKVRFKGLFRVLLIVPWAVPNYITALIWKWMFTSQVGAINLMLEAVGLKPVTWFGPSFWTNFFAALVTNTWLGFPFMMVVSMGALQSIPAEMYEAAEVDGASRFQKFRYITLPLLKPALFPAVILGSIWTFNMFNVIFLVTRGNPDNKTNILITEAYRFFAELNQYGVAAAYCVLIFIILLLYTLITNRITRATQGAFE